MSVDFDVSGQQGMDFFTIGKAFLWIMDSYFGQKQMYNVKIP